jgi:hypothetical protein
MKTSATNKKIRELIQAVREQKLIPRPDFQRRLVWSREDKAHFIDSILKGYPFPEIYFADGDVDLQTGEGTQQLVDGLQRVNTIFQYFEGLSDSQFGRVTPYRELKEEDKKAFLQYDVAVRDLGALKREEIIETFKRLNATKYSLLDIEVNNAVYAGSFKRFAERIAELGFFEAHQVFNASDLKRMGDLRYALSLIVTMLGGYSNRDDAFEEMLSLYNDEFPHATDIERRLLRVIDFIEECGFNSKSKVWRKADLFTLIIELDVAFEKLELPLQPSDVLDSLERLYNPETGGEIDFSTVAGIYYKAALQASNDRLNRVRRGVVVIGKLMGRPDAEILENLGEAGLI